MTRPSIVVLPDGSIIAGALAIKRTELLRREIDLLETRPVNPHNPDIPLRTAAPDTYQLIHDFLTQRLKEEECDTSGRKSGK